MGNQFFLTTDRKDERSRTMRTSARSIAIAFAAGACFAPLGAHAFNSGSTGADGAFNPTVSQTVPVPPSGIFNYTSVSIPAGVVITFQKNTTNTPVVILAAGDVTVAGSIDVRGTPSADVGASGVGAAQGVQGDDGTPGKGGPGGFDGGRGGVSLAGQPLLVQFNAGAGIRDVLNAAREDPALLVKEQQRVFRDRRPRHISAFEFHRDYQSFTPGPRADRG